MAAVAGCFSYFQQASTRIRTNSTLRVYIGEAPTSLDPLDFNLVKHMPIQSMLNAKLFSVYKDAGISGQVVNNWRSENGNRVWRFNIREDLRFSDGTALTPSIVALSLKRLFFVLKKRQSNNAVLSNLIDLERLTSPSAPSFQAIAVDQKQVVVKMKSPSPKFAELMGFGLYAIVHPNNFNSNTGDWLNLPIENYVGLGPYKVLSASSKGILVRLKTDYPLNLFHAKAFPLVELLSEEWENSKVDLRFSSEDLQLTDSNYQFRGAGKMGIFYFICFSWKLPGSACHSKTRRMAIRDAFLSEFKSRSVNSTSSFFPMLISGIEVPEFSFFAKSFPNGKRESFRFVDLRAISKSKNVIDAQNALEAAIRVTGNVPVSLVGMSYEDETKNRNPNLKEFTVDVGFGATSLSVIDPEGDVRFMFTSEGINLPDVSGKIRREISRKDFSIQKVNQELFDQAVVWPVAHVARGIWSSPRVDLSRYGTLFPLGELQWIGER